jgi:hypothetical protein
MQSMTWAPVWQAVLMNLVVPLVTALVIAGCTYLVSRLPGPIQAALSSATHKRDLELVVGAMARKAMEQVVSGGAVSAIPAVMAGEVVAYAQANLPGTLAKLAPDAATLQTMATAAVGEAMAKLAPAVAAVVPADALPAKGVL